MPRFRSPSGSVPHAALTPDTVRAVVGEAVRPAHFFAGSGLSLRWEGPVSETVPWEVFQGRLLDPAFTRQRRSFEAWQVFADDEGGPAAEPLLSVKLDAEAGQVHVTRALHCYAWEGYDAGGGVYLSRETRKWARELVGTLHLAELADEDELRDELICRLFQAVVGTSRLPLTSLEAPLPAFSLGRLAYCYRPGARPDAGPLRSWAELAALPRQVNLAPLERAKLLETLLHATPAGDLGAMAGAFFGDGASAVALLQRLFNEASLSPYTDLADKTLTLLRALEERGSITAAGHVDFLGRLLRQLVRHLSAYDLVTFHQRGANYPDALLLDALLRAFLDLAESHPSLFADAGGRAARLRRRALRQAWLVRSWYEGLAVPDVPTSQGEALRVLPGQPRVPEEQILQPNRRQRHLFAGEPIADRRRAVIADVLEQAVRDLAEPEELRELGTALFLDRPFGVGKAPTEPDATLLLSCEAFSPSLAERRLQHLADKLHLLSAEDLERHRQQLRTGAPYQPDAPARDDQDPSLARRAGIPVATLPGSARPGVVALADARQAARDFRLLRTTPRSVRDFLDLYDFTDLRHRFRLDWLAPDARLLLVGGPGPSVLIHDGDLRPRLELAFDPACGWRSRAGIEFPASGLRVLRIWDDGPTPTDLRGEDFVLHVRRG